MIRQDSELNGNKHFPNLICSDFLREYYFCLVNVVFKYFNFDTFSRKNISAVFI